MGRETDRKGGRFFMKYMSIPSACDDTVCEGFRHFFYNFSMRIDEKETDTIIDKLELEINEPILKKCMSNLFANLYVSIKHSLTAKKIVPATIGMADSSFPKKREVGDDLYLPPKKFREVVELLKNKGFIKYERGDDHRKMKTKLRPTYEFQKVLHELGHFKIQNRTKPQKYFEVIIKESNKNGKKKKKKSKTIYDYNEYNENLLTDKSKAANGLEKLNSMIIKSRMIGYEVDPTDARNFSIELLDHHFGSLRGQEVIADNTNHSLYFCKVEYNSYDLQYNRIFDGKLNVGGRFYGTVTQIKSELRLGLFIDNETTCEVDWKGALPSILYGLKGIQIEEDLYSIDDSNERFTFNRDHVKGAFVRMCNTPSKKAAIESVKKFLKGSKDWWSLKFSYNEDEDQLALNWTTTLIRLIEKRHDALKDFFYQNIWAFYNFIESQAMERAILKLADQDIVCLPVHDCLIVKYSDREQAEEAMREGYVSVVRDFHNNKTEDVQTLETTTSNYSSLEESQPDLYQKINSLNSMVLEKRATSQLVQLVDNIVRFSVQDFHQDFHERPIEFSTKNGYLINQNSRL